MWHSHEISIINLVHFFFPCQSLNSPITAILDAEGAESKVTRVFLYVHQDTDQKNFSCKKSIEIHTHILLNIIVIVMDKSCF